MPEEKERNNAFFFFPNSTVFVITLGKGEIKEDGVKKEKARWM